MKFKIICMSTQLKNDLLLRTIRGENTERTPIWMMRQAGRILPEYREVRNNFKDFKSFIKSPESAAEVTIQPVDILGVDAAIIFSDILVIPEAMGVPYQMIEKKGPYFPYPIRSEKAINSLRTAEIEEKFNYVLKAITITKEKLDNRVPLIGFAGAPWTIFAYIVEGQGTKTFSLARKFLYRHPQLSHRLLDKITKVTIAYLKAQVKSGVDLIQIFDSWAGILPPYQYHEFSIPYLKQICDAITEVPKVVFAKDAFFARKWLKDLNCEVIGMDWCMEAEETRSIVGNDKILQGNFDPCALYADENQIRSLTKNMLDQFGYNKHIANLGHGLYPDIEYSKAKYFVDCVKELSKKEAAFTA